MREHPLTWHSLRPTFCFVSMVCGGCDKTWIYRYWPYKGLYERAKLPTPIFGPYRRHSRAATGPHES